MATREQTVRNRATSKRLDAWLDAVYRAPARRQLLRRLEIRGLAQLAGLELTPERVSMVPAAVPRRAPAAPSMPRTTCMSFEGCGGTGERIAEDDESCTLYVYCWCAAGVNLRIADGAPPHQEERRPSGQV